MGARFNWFLLRLMWIFSPTVAVVAVAVLVNGAVAAAVLLLAIAAVMAAGGYRVRGQRRFPD